MPQNTSTLGFLLLGPLQKNSTITKEFLQKHNVTYLGECSDVRDFIARSFCVVLPSYYKEGVPRVLLEAMSMEKPIITTNVSGCRECLKPPFLPKKDFTLAQNGILIPPQDASALESAMRYLLALPLTSYQKMAKQSRVYAIQRFEISFIKQAYKDAIRHFLAPPPPRAKKHSGICVQ
ncbi:glycosyltransferase [Helicobacter mustelae]|uniref:glycosyltransferase n=1 Tax=Helicobacter mustelae TaxID=217 RepID=UPI000DA3F430|nr:glycosyltransferase [Helicobacter mustelae]SQH71438.1 glycosyltransferase [Helicobacter mustelae]